MPIRPLSFARGAVLISVACVGAASLAQDAAPAERPQNTIFAFEKEGLGALMVDPRDAALRRALEMLPARVAELPEENPDLAEAPKSILDLVAHAIIGRLFVGVTDRGNDPQTGAPGLGLSLAVGMPDEARAQAVRDEIAELIQMESGLEVTPSDSVRGMSDVQTPAGTIRFGPRKNAAGQWSMGLLAGDLPDPEAAGAALPSLEGAGGPWMRMRLDLPAAQQWTTMFAGLASMQAPQVGAMLQRRGLVGPEAIAVDVVVAQSPDALRARTTVHRAAKYARTIGAADLRLSAEHLAVIPADAMFAAAQTFDLAGIWSEIESLAKSTPEGSEALARFAEVTGLDMRTDVIDAFGNALALYTSDSTGGGGLFSAVAVVAVRDRAAIVTLFERLATFANEALEAEMPAGYVRFSHTSADGVDRLTLKFPGLPIPFESTMAVTDRWLVAGLTPQAVDGALAQCAGKGKGSLRDNASFKAVLPQMPEDLVQMMFIDSPRAIAKGYPWMSALTSAVSNAMRSPIGADREPGNLLPPYAEIASNVRPILETARWDGDNMVQVWSADRSMLVNGCAVAGIYGEIVSMLVPAIAGVAAPAIQEAKISSQQVRELTNFNQLANAWHAHAAAHDDHPPLSISALVEAGLIDAEQVESAFGDVADGGADFWLRRPGPGLARVSEIDAPAETIIAYSRSQAAVEQGVTVAFADGSVQSLTMMEFFRAMQDPANAGVDFELPVGAAPEWPENGGGRRPNFMIQPERPAGRAM